MAENKCTVVKFNGYLKFIDLGLPSGTKWAAYNVGAKSPYEAGDYFSWGNVEGHAVDAGYDFSPTNYNASPGASLTGNIPVNATYDAATANFGSEAKMPTKEQFKELCDNCTSEWTTLNGVSGMRFTSNVNGNFIFFPAAGQFNGTVFSGDGQYGLYWSSSKNSTTNAYFLLLHSGGKNPQDNYDKFRGFPVRPVM